MFRAFNDTHLPKPNNFDDNKLSYELLAMIMHDIITTYYCIVYIYIYLEKKMIQTITRHVSSVYLY